MWMHHGRLLKGGHSELGFDSRNSWIECCYEDECVSGLRYDTASNTKLW